MGDKSPFLGWKFVKITHKNRCLKFHILKKMVSNIAIPVIFHTKIVRIVFISISPWYHHDRLTKWPMFFFSPLAHVFFRFFPIRVPKNPRKKFTIHGTNAASAAHSRPWTKSLGPATSWKIPMWSRGRIGNPDRDETKLRHEKPVASCSHVMLRNVVFSLFLLL